MFWLNPEPGESANYNDSNYQDSGAQVLPSGSAVWKDSDLIVKVRGTRAE